MTPTCRGRSHAPTPTGGGRRCPWRAAEQQLHFRVLRNVRTLSERRRGWAAVDLPPNLDADSAPREALGSAAIGAPSVCRFESSSAFAGQSAAVTLT